MARLPPALRGKPLDWGDDEAATRVQSGAAQLSLIAREGPLHGHVFGTDGEPITIGRGSSCGVQLALSDISRQHAIIRYRSGRYWVEDLQTLNGTRVNEQLIDRPTALNQGDRIRISAQEFEVRFDALANREVVWDGPNSAAVSVTPAPRASRRMVRPPLRSIGVAAVVVVLAISSGVLLAYAVTRQSRRAAAVAARTQPSHSAAAQPSGASAATTPAPLVRARVEVDGSVAVIATQTGRVAWSAARGTPVRTGDDLVRLRLSNAAKQRELDRINEKLEDNDSNPELARRAHEVADELEAAPTAATIKSDFDGVVVTAPAMGARMQVGFSEMRVAHRIRLVVDPSAIVGAGSACRVTFLDQKLVADGLRVVGDVGATIELTRFPENLSFEALGRARADCK
jgi:predicted component of type VI protein secretion system